MVPHTLFLALLFSAAVDTDGRCPSGEYLDERLQCVSRTLNFDDATVEGVVTRPSLEYVISKKPARFQCDDLEGDEWLECMRAIYSDEDAISAIAKIAKDFEVNKDCPRDLNDISKLNNIYLKYLELSKSEGFVRPDATDLIVPGHMRYGGAYAHNNPSRDLSTACGYHLSEQRWFKTSFHCTSRDVCFSQENYASPHDTNTLFFSNGRYRVAASKWGKIEEYGDYVLIPLTKGIYLIVAVDKNSDDAFGHYLVFSPKAGCSGRDEQQCGARGSRINPKTGSMLFWVPGGVLNSGCEDYDSDCSNDEKIREKLYVKGFWMMENEVTVAEYEKCVSFGACASLSNYNDSMKTCNSGKGWLGHPMNCINQMDAASFCSWAGGRLPSGYEWEYAAKSGGHNYRYPWGFSPPEDDHANFNKGDGWMYTSPVGIFPKGANMFGIKDMAGNVWEWTSSTYQDGDASSFEVRGGSWLNSADKIRSSNRGRLPRSSQFGHLGFRCMAN